MNGDSVLNLALILLKNMSVIITFAYFLSRVQYLKKLLAFPFTLKEKTFFVLFFGLLSLIGTYLGIYILDAYANIRGIGAMMGGLLGGPVVGLLAGMIGGLHRYTLGGFTALACAIGTTSTGLIGGLFHKKYIKGKIDYGNGFLIGFMALSLEMGIVILFSRPLTQALELVRIIGLPMVLSNAFGIAIFINILNKIKEEKEKIRAFQAEKVLDIADKTLPLLREGLNRETAGKIVKMIKKASDVDAVALTDKAEILAFHGLGSDHHKPGSYVQTDASKKAYEKGIIITADSKSEIGCSRDACTLTDVVIVPIKLDDKVFGLLKLYRSQEKINMLDIKLARGIASLLATQIKLGKMTDEAELKSEAELKALQAQINPHFLFNALNTITATCRINPEQSRELLMKLSGIFRKTLKRNVHQSSLKDEVDFCKDYLGIEKVRMGDRLTVNWDLPDNIGDYLIPPFIIQPLVENSVIHGIQPIEGKGEINISIKPEGESLIINVSDNGQGISRQRLDNLFASDDERERIGLKNLKRRIENLFGDKAGFKIESKLDNGTEVEVTLPLLSVSRGEISV